MSSALVLLALAAEPAPTPAEPAPAPASPAPAAPAPAEPTPAPAAPAPAAPAPSPAPTAAAPAPAAPAPSPAPTAAAPASSSAPVLPPVAHVTTDPLLPQKYRTVPQGKYECSVIIDVSKEGRATDVNPTACGQEEFWALATAILQWDFDPATQNGVPVDAKLPYTSTFEVKTLLPRKHVVGFVGVVANAGGDGYGGIDGRIHLGERFSFSGGVSIDRDLYESSLVTAYTPSFHADFALSSPRQYTEHRGIYGLAIGGYGDSLGGYGTYFGFRGEVMSPVPGLSFGGDAGLAIPFGQSPVYEDVGPWKRAGGQVFLPWLRASVIWYAPIPRDQFVVVPRVDDPVVYEPVIPEPEPLPDVAGKSFEGIPAVHWSALETSVGQTTPTGPGFAAYPPGTYTCNVRVAVSPEGRALQVRAEKCPSPGRADAEKNVASWEWPRRDDGRTLQAVFPAPIFVLRDDAVEVRATSVQLLVDGKATPLPRTVETPHVWVHERVRPVWTTDRPTRACYVDVDLDATGKPLGRKWAGGDVEVQARVYEALDQWRFYPVPVDGELSPVRVRLSMCDD